MPIRHCQKCGLKVLIDESQLGANPFYCQRCAATLTGDAPDPGDETIASPATEAVAAAVEKPKGPVKLTCPYCKGVFSGRLPTKPAKGGCPTCRKELVLLPTGEIQPAATFDVSKYKQMAPDEPTTGDQLAAAKRALEKVRQAKSSGSTPAVPEPETAEAAPEPEPEPPVETVESPPPSDENESVVVNPPPPVEEPAPEPPPPPPEPAPEAAVPTKKIASRIRRGEGAAAAVAAPAATGMGKVVLAAILMLLPFGGGVAFWKLRDKALKNVVTKLGAFGAKGFLQLHARITKKEPPPPPKEEKKEEKKDESSNKTGPVDDPEQRAADEKKILDVVQDLHRQKRSLKEKEVGDPNNPELEPWRQKVKELEDKLENLQVAYEKAYGSRFKIPD